MTDFKNRFPEWINGNEDFTLCLSDDIDSLVASAVISKVKGWEIEHFYDFHNLYSTDLKDKRTAVGVDIALVEGRTFDNHVVRLSENSIANPLSANPNVVYPISRKNYTKKYALSTALLVWSLYDLPLPSTDEGKMMLMSIDSSFKGYYSGFKQVQVEWLRRMGLDEIIHLQERYSSGDFYKVKKDKFFKIQLDDNGYLQSDMQLEEISNLLEMNITLPEKQFVTRNEFTSGSMNLDSRKQYNNNKFELDHNPVSMALTETHKLKLTTR